MSIPAIARCDTCHGPALWTLDKAGDVWQLCQDATCSSNVQTDLFPEEPIWEERVRSPMESGDTVDHNHVN